ncbi:hypothetical protein TrLO_g9310 [Triparma laevis f. longispina]|uniref:Uncharacterized protein n=1 Tax=Triparma laevis f. longispina TaxID=1714387 RepID=A0A9W7KTQ2_9STRA|nr:hypothetical protein TrLO_g9310 [Triparma laevis f. longispina]
MDGLTPSLSSTLTFTFTHLKEFERLGTKFAQIGGFVGSRGYEYAQQLLSSFFSFTRQEKQTSAEEGMESLVAIWVVSAASFAPVIKREYLHTFYDADTSSDFNRKAFLNLREDEEAQKSALITCHPDNYKKNRDVVKKWTLKNWHLWEEEKSAWFTDAWIDGVDNVLIPYDWRVKYKKTKGGLKTTN